jgi:hypothetical protein
MLRWFPLFQVASTCLSRSPPDLNSVVTNCLLSYTVWQKSNETCFLLTVKFISVTNRGYPLQNSSLEQLHSDEGVVSIVRSSAGIPFSSSVTLFWILSKVPKWRPFKWCFSRGNEKKSQGLRSGE